MAHLPELALADDGRCVTPLLYAPLSYRSADGQFEIKVDTSYPRQGTIDFRIRTKSSRVLQLPIPGWCRGWTLSVGDKKVSVPAENGFVKVDVPASKEMAVRLELKMVFSRKICDIGGRRYAEYAYGPLVLVRDTGFGGRLGEAISEDVRFVHQDTGYEVFARFTGIDRKGRSHVLVDYAHACRRSPDADEFEIFIPVQK